MAISTLYQVNKNFQGINSFGTNFSVQCYAVELSATTDTTIAVPLNAVVGMAPAQTTNNTFIAVFHYAVTTPFDVYVALNTTASAPSTHSFALTQSVLNPTGKVCKAGDVLHFYSPTGGNVTVEFFSTQEN